MHKLNNEFGISVRFLHSHVSMGNVATTQHNTAQHNGRTLDQYVVHVCTLENGRIAADETFVSDIENFSAFFFN
ncbi:hypothetical protein [Nocardia sp. NPDC050175]|uniref:hypothetical protein n=1 Tax=Nocardia sp. NPDC050175 TaxID=3364317 RepID=UPI0037A29C86